MQTLKRTNLLLGDTIENLLRLTDRPLIFRVTTTFFATLLLTVSAGSRAQSTTALDLPQLGEPADLVLSPAQEQKLGNEVAAELYSGDYLVEDPEISDYISSIGWRLAAKGAEAPTSFRFMVIGDPRINAFAVPGGLIGVNAGLLLAADNESELAGVMGHEQAHVTQRHLARTSNDTRTANVATWLATIAAIIAGSANPDLILGALAIGQSVNSQREVNYTRAHELEADRIGIRTMAEAGFDPEGMATFFAKLEQQSRLYGIGAPEFLRTHPVNTTRVSEARQRAAQMPKVLNRKDSIEFALMKARTQVVMSELPNDAVESFGQRVRSGDNSPAARYGYAYALSKVGRTDDALAALASVAMAMPRQANVNLLQADLLLAAKRSDEGRALLAKTVNLYPRYAPAVLAQAQALLDANQPADARQLLQSHDQALGTRLETYRLLSEAARAQNNVAEAQFQIAQYSAKRGDLRGALTQLDAGLRLSSINDQDRSRLIAMRQELISRIPRNQLADLARDPDRRLRSGLR